MHKGFLFVVSLLALLFLGGCIEYNDSLALKTDGSGSFEMRISIPSDLDMSMPGDSTADFFQKDSLQARLSRVPGVQLDSIRIERKEGMQSLVASMRFDSLASLQGISGENPQEDFLGKITQRKLEDGILFERIINPGDSSNGPEDQMDQLAVGVVNEMMGAIYWTYSLQVPGRILEANTSADRIDSLSGKVSWRILSTDIAGKPLTLKVKYESKNKWPWTAWVTLGIVLVVLMVALFSLYRKIQRLGGILRDRKESKG